MKFLIRLKMILPLFLLLEACESKFFPQPPLPKAAKETNILEASYNTTPPVSLNDPFWRTADYLKVPVIDLNKKSLYNDGFLNMSGTYNGLLSFNKGDDPKLIMKAAYDNTKVYIYMEWIDSDISPTNESSILNGPIDPLKSDTAIGWTSQGKSDKIALAFEISNAKSSEGTFTDKGCAASCHQNKMQPESGSVDIWNWDIALSEPLGYARDMNTNSIGGLKDDAGDVMAIQNKTIPNNPRSRPLYEWNGIEQTVTRPDGKTTILDPAFYLLNKTPFIGDLAKGDATYHDKIFGCNHCHGDAGEGTGSVGEGTAFANTGFASKYSRELIKSFSGSDEHTGISYWQQVPSSLKEDMIAYIKGMGSLPGYYLSLPTGSNANIWSVSNVSRSRINTNNPHTLYKVIMVRDLKTDNPDDTQFDSPQGKSYPFGIALMDNDGKNHIGSLKQILKFKNK